MLRNQILFFFGFFLLSGFAVADNQAQPTKAPQESLGIEIKSAMRCMEKKPDINYTFCGERIKIVQNYCYEMAEFIDEDCWDVRAKTERDKNLCAEKRAKNEGFCYQRVQHDSAVCLAAYARDIAGCLPPNPGQAFVWENIRQISWQGNRSQELTPFELLSLKKEESLNAVTVKCLLKDADLNYKFCRNKVKDEKDYCRARAATVKIHCKNKAQSSKVRNRCEKEYERSEAGCEKQMKEDFVVCAGVFTTLVASCMEQNIAN